MPISSVRGNLLPYEERLQWVALPSAFHFVHNPSWKNLLPLLIHHKRWKGDPSIVQAHEGCSLLQWRYDLPIPLTHTTLVSPPSYEMYVKDDRRALALEMRKEQRGWCSQCGNKPFFGDFISPAVCLYVLPQLLSPGYCPGIVQGLSARFKYTLECETDFYCP